MRRIFEKIWGAPEEEKRTISSKEAFDQHVKNGLDIGELKQNRRRLIGQEMEDADKKYKELSDSIDALSEKNKPLRDIVLPRKVS